MRRLRRRTRRCSHSTKNSTTNGGLRLRNQELKTIRDDVVRARDYADASIDTISDPLLVLEPIPR